MPDKSTLAIETNLAAAHRRLWNAQQFAEARRDQGLAEDLYNLKLEVERIQVALLRGDGAKRRPVAP